MRCYGDFHLKRQQLPGEHARLWEVMRHEMGAALAATCRAARGRHVGEIGRAAVPCQASS
jgi:hypothetical protein